MFAKCHKSLVIRIVTLALAIPLAISSARPVSVSAMSYAAADPGTLDITFGSGGLVTTSMSYSRDEGHAVAIQPDGKILVAGVADARGNSDFALIRYNPDGSLDTSFDTDGKVTTDFAGYPDFAEDLALQSDGNIVAAGFSNLSSGPLSTSMALARYNPDGSLDTSFDLDGKATISVGGFFKAVAIQADGKIVGVGGPYGITVVRYNPDGSLDRTFDTDGVVTTHVNGGTEYGTSLVIQPDGKIIAGGVTGTGSDMDLTLVRYNSDGSLDTSFAGTGIVITNFPGGSNPQDNARVALQPDGKIILAGNNEYLLLARYNANGSLDTSFGTNGLVATPSNMPVSDMALQRNGKIVIVKNAIPDFTILRFNPDGSADITFGTDFGSNLDDSSTAVAIQADGNIVVAGYRNTLSYYDAYVDIALARYMGDDPALISYVKWDATGANSGASWADAYTDLQSALAAAASGDEIWVAAGTYKPTTGTDRTATFQLKDGVAVFGGFAGTETTRDQRNPAANITVLSGDINNDDSQTPVVTDLHTVSGNTANSYHVVTGATGGTLDGFTITAGYADGSSPFNCGGGMYNSNSAPTLANVTFSGNFATESGGGMSNQINSSPVLTNVAFHGNAATSDGGGMVNITSSSPTLANVTFSENSAEYGGGMYNQFSSSPTLVNVTFSENSAAYGGGMSNQFSSHPALTNVTFRGNTASFGGGLENYSHSNGTIRNAVFWDNTATSGGAQIYNNIASTPAISDSVVQDGCPAGSTCTNIITANPMLGMLGDYGGSTQTIPLLSGSSAIDAGNDANCPATDQRGVARPQGAHCDIGAYEYVDTTAPTVTISSTVPDPTNTSPIPATVQFSETVTGFIASDITVTNGAVNNFMAVDGDIYTFDLIPSEQGIVTANIVQNAAVDASGNGNIAAPPFSRTYDTVDPIITINRAAGAENPTNATSVDFAVTFSERVTDVSTTAPFDDFVLTTTGVTGASITDISGADTVWTVTVNTGTGNGPIRLDVPATATIRDLAGNSLDDLPFTGGEVYTIAKLPGAGIYEDTDSHWVYSSGWMTYTGNGPSGNNYHYTRTPGSFAELKFTGVKFILTYARYSNYGLIDVYVDGSKVGVINSYSPTLAWQVKWTSPTLTAGDHTVRFVHAGPVRKYINIDAIQILDSAAIPAGKYDDMDNGWTYDNFRATTASGPYLRTFHYSNGVGSTAEFTFTGSQITLTYSKYRNHGNLEVYIDGVLVTTINQYSATRLWQASWTSTDLGAGTHTVKLMHASGATVDIDAIEIVLKLKSRRQ